MQAGCTASKPQEPEVCVGTFYRPGVLAPFFRSCHISLSMDLPWARLPVIVSNVPAFLVPLNVRLPLAHRIQEPGLCRSRPSVPSDEHSWQTSAQPERKVTPLSMETLSLLFLQATKGTCRVHGTNSQG